MQTKLQSFIEAWANVIIGFGINMAANMAANMAVLPLFGYHVSAGQAFGMGVVFTGISVVRSYFIRRWFNGFVSRAFK